MKPNMSALFLVTLLIATHLSAQSQRMSLDEILRLAMAQNRSLKAAELDVLRADESVKAANTQRLPSLAVTADFGESLTRPYLQIDKGILGSVGGAPLPDEPVRLTSARSPSFFAVGQAVEPLSRQYQIGLEIKALKLGKEIGSERLRASRQEVARQVRGMYAQLVDETNAVDAAKADVALYIELERVTSLYVLEHTVLRSELLQVQSRLLHARYEQTIAANTLSEGKERLNLLMGRSVDEEFEVDTGFDQVAELPTQSEAIASALRFRPDLREARLQVERTDLDRRAKKAEYIPEVSLNTNFVNLAGSGLPVGGGGYAEVGLQLKWEPFDWGRKHHEIAEKAAAVSQARLAVTEAQSKARIEVYSALRNIQASRQLLESALLGQQAAEESLRVIDAQYAQQAALLDAVLQAQSALMKAREQVRQTRASIRTDTATLSKAMGEDL